MNISATAALTGLPAKTIRYYEDIGLVMPARAANGYRSYSEQQIHRLAFIQRARSLGFSVEDCRTLLSLYEDKHRASADVKSLAVTHLKEIESKIGENAIKAIHRHLDLENSVHAQHYKRRLAALEEGGNTVGQLGPDAVLKVTLISGPSVM